MATARKDKIFALAALVVAVDATTDDLSLTAYFPVPGTLMVTEVASLETTVIPVVVITPSLSILTPS
jgi:hypothetical protein